MTTLSLQDLNRDLEVLRIPPVARIEPDQDRAGDLEQKRAHALDRLGDRWLLHPKNRIQRIDRVGLPQRPAEVKR